MKIGVLCEGENSDEDVIRELLQHRFPQTEFIIRGKTKRVIFEAADLEIEDLLKKGAERILIVWDLLPVGHQMAVSSQWSEKPSRREQRQKLLEQLSTADELREPVRLLMQHLAYRYTFSEFEVPHPSNGIDVVTLVCVCYTLENWLTVDGAILREIASSDAHKADRWSPPDPDRNPHAAAQLRSYLTTAPNRKYRRYNKMTDNVKLVREYLERGKFGAFLTCDSFRRMIDTVNDWGAK